MDNKLMESYLETICELVIDEEKIVTYKSISRNLGVHVNTAKQLLHTFLLKQKDEGTCPISATYLLAGKFDDGSLNVTVINESDLKKTSEKFVEITSRHVYSVQKGNELKDVRVLAGIGKEVQNAESSNVVIKCSKSFIKERPGLSENNTQNLENERGSQSKSETIQKVHKIDNEEPCGKSETPVGSKEQNTTKSPVKESPPDNKTKTKSPTKVNSDKKPLNSKSSNTTRNIANFFGNAAQKNSEKSTGSLEKKKNISNNKDDKNSTLDIPQIVKIDVLNENKAQVVTNKKRSKSKESLKKKKEGSKRKRIQVFSDSEESNSGHEEEPSFQKEDEEEEENTEPPSTILEEEKEEDIKGTTRNKRKKRKLIDKTFVNENGYLETRKEFVFETDSEDDSNLQPEKETNSSNQQPKRPKPDKEEEKSKIIPATNAPKKQASLLSFFKKN